jgi:hypothetical protein
MPIPPKPAYVKTVTDSEWRSLKLGERALHVARSQVGVRESSENWGPMVRAYLAVAGLFSPAPWCAAFVTWCLLEAGAVRSKLPKLAASTYWWFVWAQSTKRLRSIPRRGDIGVVNGAKGGHEFFVRMATGKDEFSTIEGNTNDEGSREGYEVCDRERSVRGYMMKFVRWGFIDVEGLD